MEVLLTSYLSCRMYGTQGFGCCFCHEKPDKHNGNERERFLGFSVTDKKTWQSMNWFYKDGLVVFAKCWDVTSVFNSEGCLSLLLFLQTASLFTVTACVCSGSRPQNLIAQSQSGTGKTAAFSLAMLSHVDPDNKWPQVGFTHSVRCQYSVEKAKLHSQICFGACSVSAFRQRMSWLCRLAKSLNKWASFVLMLSWHTAFGATEVRVFSHLHCLWMGWLGKD